MFCPIIQSTNYPVLGISKSFFFDFQKLSHHHGIMRCLATEKKSCVGIRGLNPRGGEGGGLPCGKVRSWIKPLQEMNLGIRFKLFLPLKVSYHFKLIVFQPGYCRPTKLDMWSSYQFLEQMLDLTHQYQKIYTLDHSPFAAELLPSRAPEIYANNLEQKPV